MNKFLKDKYTKLKESYLSEIGYVVLRRSSCNAPKDGRQGGDPASEAVRYVNAAARLMGT